MGMAMSNDLSPIERARGAAKLIAPLASEIESGRRLPRQAVDALVNAGVFKLVVPRAFGGQDAPASVLLDVIEEIARADGSAGWCVMIGATSALMSAYLEESIAREVYSPANAITCGVFAPTGRAVAADDGWRVSGRWAWASGCEHSAWRMVGTLATDAPPLAGGAPDVRSMLLRADETTVIDTWDVSGLRGTGSHDLEVKDVVVPSARAFSLFTTAARKTGPIHDLPFFGVLAAGVASVSLGIARAAIDSFVELAKNKTPMGSKRGIAHRELVQHAVASAEAKVRASRAFLRETIDAAAREASQHEAASLRTRALMRLAACQAATESAAAVDLMYTAAGGSSVHATSPLQRCFRDVHVTTQHVMVGGASSTLAGRVLLGVESDTSTL